MKIKKLNFFIALIFTALVVLLSGILVVHFTNKDDNTAQAWKNTISWGGVDFYGFKGKDINYNSDGTPKSLTDRYGFDAVTMAKTRFHITDINYFTNNNGTKVNVGHSDASVSSMRMSHSESSGLNKYYSISGNTITYDRYITAGDWYNVSYSGTIYAGDGFRISYTITDTPSTSRSISPGTGEVKFNQDRNTSVRTTAYVLPMRYNITYNTNGGNFSDGSTSKTNQTIFCDPYTSP